MRIVPDSTINLYSNVQIDSGEQLVFSSVANQLAYFQAALAVQQVPCTVVRKTGRLRVEVSGAVISNCNYLSFVNPTFDDKIIYARIIDYDYINNECVEIAYAIDYWQTWMFDVQFDEMYIEREHLSEEDWQKAESNPYDPSIYEFRTNETLPISKDLEKPLYDIGVDADHGDGYKLQDALSYLTSISDSMGVLVKLANIDLEDLDGTTTEPQDKLSFELANILEATAGGGPNSHTHADDNTSIGYYYLTSEMANYLNAEYNGQQVTPTTPGAPTYYVPNIYKGYKFNGGWSLGGHPANPFIGTRYQPGCTFIYFPQGASYTNQNEGLGSLIGWLTKTEKIDQIIDIVIIPARLMFFCATDNNGMYIEAQQRTADQAYSGNIESKKLFRFPFSYLRAIAPNGDIKEFKYEYFQSAIQGDGYCGFSVCMDVADKPTLIMAPKQYRYDNMSMAYNDGDNANILEAIMFDQFPTMPFTIDAFTAQVAAVANAAIADRTADNDVDMAVTQYNTNEHMQNMRMFSAGMGVASGALSGGSSVVNASPKNLMSGGTISAGLGTYGSVVGGLADLGSLSMQQSADREHYRLLSERWGDAENALANPDASAIAIQMKNCKPAYAADKYFMSNGVGAVNFNRVSFCDLILLRVSLDDTIMEAYDKYFKLYGYTSGRCGMPRVINYVQGQTSDDLVPHWEVVDTVDTTYIKTMDCKIKYSMLPVANFIKSMFDNGVRMIKGD